VCEVWVGAHRHAVVVAHDHVDGLHASIVPKPSDRCSSARQRHGVAAKKPQPETDRRTKKVDALFTRWDRQDSPGCAVGIIKDGEFVYKRGYGMADLEHGIPITPQSVFYLSSTSKQFTAATAAVLAIQGKLSLDDDVRKHVPELPKYDKTITVRDLIYHTSGLRDYFVIRLAAGQSLEDYWNNDDVVRLLTRQKGLTAPPGTEFRFPVGAVPQPIVFGDRVVQSY